MLFRLPEQLGDKCAKQGGVPKSWTRADSLSRETREGLQITCEVWQWSEYSNTRTCVFHYRCNQAVLMVYIYTVVEYIHHILFAVMPLVGIAQFNTDPLENFCLAEWWMEQQSQLQDSARGHSCRHHYKHQQCWMRYMAMADNQLPYNYSKTTNFCNRAKSWHPPKHMQVDVWQ